MREISFFYHLLDKNNNFLKVLGGVQSCSLACDYGEGTILSGTLRIREDTSIDWANDRIQPFIKLNGQTTSMGVYVTTYPNKEKYEDIEYRNVGMHSMLVLLQRDKLEGRTLIAAGTNVINEVKRLINSNTYTTLRYDITEGAFYSSADAWYDPGTPKLTVINDLLKSINYVPLYPTRDGKFKSDPYILPINREKQIEYIAGRGCIMHKQAKEVKNLYDIPNVYIRYTNNAQINPPLISKYENDNPNSPTSTVNAPRNVDAKTVSGVTDQNTLNAVCKKDAYNGSQIYSDLLISTAINPNHWVNSCVWVDYHDGGHKYIGSSWKMDLKVGGEMSHSLRRVVVI